MLARRIEVGVAPRRPRSPVRGHARMWSPGLCPRPRASLAKPHPALPLRWGGSDLLPLSGGRKRWGWLLGGLDPPFGDTLACGVRGLCPRPLAEPADSTSDPSVTRRAARGAAS